MEATKENETVMGTCLTRPLLFGGSGCLIEKPECGYAHKFGFSFVCRHPDHTNFHAHVTGALAREDGQKLYDTLRQKRRDEFVASLDETSKDIFCLQTDFYGQSLTR